MALSVAPLIELEVFHRLTPAKRKKCMSIMSMTFDSQGRFLAPAYLHDPKHQPLKAIPDWYAGVAHRQTLQERQSCANGLLAKQTRSA